LGNPSDRTELLSLVRQTKHDLGIKPKALATDRGYYSTDNVLALCKAGIKRVGIPKVGRLSPKEKKHQQAKWFRQLQRFRCGIEGSISMLNASSGWDESWRKGLKPARSGPVSLFSPTTCGSELD